ncbi:MAG: CopY family transcriptional regulator [Peptococcaceae bacterium BICA1-8]|nr:MAG: CopY family transcriptional regulator [Peptococcaceae bacterium BICA1-8]
MTIKKLFSDFKPFSHGIAKVLGHLEADIMEIIWQKGKVSVREVYEQLALEREIAYTTVMTIMGRLAEKNILIKEARGNAYLYYPILSKEEFTGKMVGNVIDGLMEDYADAAFAHFMKKIGKEDARQLERLEELIRQHKGQEENND